MGTTSIAGPNIKHTFHAKGKYASTFQGNHAENCIQISEPNANENLTSRRQDR
jgi:hypothetical protein